MRASILGCVGAALLIAALAPDARAQTPDLYDGATIRTLRFTFRQSNWWQLLQNNYSQKIDIRADLQVDNKTYPDVGFRFRGSSSYVLTGSSRKKSFNVTMDAFTPGQHLYGYENLNLSNAFNDPTFLREVLSYEIQRRYIPAPKCNFVNVYLNNEYWGIYVNVQQPDKTMIGEWFDGDDGNRYRGDPPTGSSTKSALQWQGTSPAPYQAAYQLKTTQSANPWTDLIHACDVLNNMPPASYPSAINVDRALWYLALMNVLVNLDSYVVRGNDYYIYFSEVGSRLNTIPWDMNESFGGFDANLSVSQRKNLSPFYQETNTERPLLRNLLAVPKWRAQYVAHLRTILTESFSPATLDPLITAMHAQISADVLADTKKLYSSAFFTQALTQNVTVGSGPWATTLPAMRPFVRDRHAALMAHPDIARAAPTISNVAHSPSQPIRNQAVVVTAAIGAATTLSTVELEYATGETFTATPMFDDGLHGDGAPNDGVYGASIPGTAIGATVRYFVRAWDASGSMSLDPPRAELVTHDYTVAPPTATSPVRISELLAKNANGIRDENNELEDWLELENTGSAPVDLSGAFLTDTLALPTRWRIPLGTIVAPGATLLVWCDDEVGEGPLHANFKLSGSGETIALFATDGVTLLDSVTFGPQVDDVSTGRIRGVASATWVTLPQPTPRAPNRAEPCGHLPYRALDVVVPTVRVTAQGTPTIGASLVYSVTGAPASTSGLVAVGFEPAHAALGALGTLLVDVTATALLPIRTDATGAAALPLGVPNAPALRGVVAFVQGFVHDGTGGGLSGAIATRICP